METVRKNIKYLIIASIMLVITIIGIIFSVTVSKVDAVYGTEILSRNDAEQIYSVAPISLDKGIYEITIKYSSSNGALVNVYTNDAKSHKTLYTDNPELSKYENVKSFDIWVNDNINNLGVEVRPNEGSLYVESIAVKTAWNSVIYGVTKCILLFALAILVLCAVKFRYKYKKYGIQILVITFITLFSSLGLFVRYLLPGHDLVFHLLRIEGIKDSILMGDIPSRVQTNWIFGYGYAVSAMYGDTTLLLPALMRILGFPIQSAYKVFMFLVNLGTSILTYWCFRKMCKRNVSAYIGTFLYVCAPYRLINIYNRAAVGETVAMMFLPLALLGFYYAYHEDDGREDYGKHIVAPVIGFSGLIQTHLLSCVIVAIFAVPFCLINIKKTFSRNRLFYLLKLLGLTLLINLWFIVPFIRFMNEPLLVTLGETIPADFQAYGLTIPELFAQYSSGHFWYNFAFMTSLSQRNTMSFGNGIAIILIGFAVLMVLKKFKKKTKHLTVLAIVCLIALFLSSNLFPYSILIKYCPILAGILTKVQFPYRYLAMAVLFGSIFAMAFYDKFVKKCKKEFVIAFTCAVLMVASSQSLNHVYALLYSGNIVNNYDDASLYSAEVIGAQYLYTDTDIDECEFERNVTGSNVDITGYKRSRNRFDVECVSRGDEAKLLLPVFAYPGYIAMTEFGDELNVARGLNNRLTVDVPDNYMGTIMVRYKEPILWRGAELISLIGVVLLIYLYECNKKGLTDDQIQ